MFLRGSAAGLRMPCPGGPRVAALCLGGTMRDSIDQELKLLERRYWDAVQQKDSDEAIALSDESCIVVGAQGVGAIDRKKLGQMLQAASYELKQYALDDKQFQVRQIADNVAV